MKEKIIVLFLDSLEVAELIKEILKETGIGEEVELEFISHADLTNPALIQRIEISILDPQWILHSFGVEVSRKIMLKVREMRVPILLMHHGELQEGIKQPGLRLLLKPELDITKLTSALEYLVDVVMNAKRIRTENH